MDSGLIHRLLTIGCHSDDPYIPFRLEQKTQAVSQDGMIVNQ